MRAIKAILLLSWLLLSAPVLAAEPAIVVVVSSDSEVQALSHSELIDLYMGRYTTLPNRQAASLIDHAEQSAIRQQFYRALVNKSVAEVNAFWARLLFIGRSSPPKMLPDVGTVVQAVADSPNTVAYLYEADLSSSLRVIYRFDVDSI